MARRRRVDPAVGTPTAGGDGASNDEAQTIDPRELDAWLAQSEAELKGTAGARPSGEPPLPTQTFALPDLVPAPDGTPSRPTDLLKDIHLNVKIELGRSRMPIGDVLKLREGSVVTLDKLAGEHVDILVNGRLVARGEVLVLDNNFCVRVAEISGATE